MKNKIPKKGEVTYPQVDLFYDHILTTAWTRDITASGIILVDKQGNIETRQMVVAAGSGAAVTVGDEVEIDPGRFRVALSEPKHGIGPDVKTIQVPIEVIDGVPYLFMSTRELKYKYKRVAKIADNEELI